MRLSWVGVRLPSVSNETFRGNPSRIFPNDCPASSSIGSQPLSLKCGENGLDGGYLRCNSNFIRSANDAGWVKLSFTGFMKTIEMLMFL